MSSNTSSFGGPVAGSFTWGDVATTTIGILTLVLNIYQSIKLRHFESKCMACNGKECCDMTLEEEGK